MEKQISKEYSNGEITVVWQSKICIHAAECTKALPQAYNPTNRPWINIDNATTDEFVAQIKKCPSGALSYYMNDEENKEAESMETRIEVMENGPLLVYGTLKVTHKNGDVEIKNKTTAFCRCGHSTNKPYCDGAHMKFKFEG